MSYALLQIQSMGRYFQHDEAYRSRRDYCSHNTMRSLSLPPSLFLSQDSVKDVYRAVQLRVLSNWGNPEYSCVYRFRVHGQPLPH